MRVAPYTLLLVWLLLNGCQRKAIRPGPVFYGSSQQTAGTKYPADSSTKKEQYSITIEGDSLKPQPTATREAVQGRAELHQLSDSTGKESSSSPEKVQTGGNLPLKDSVTVTGREAYPEIKVNETPRDTPADTLEPQKSKEKNYASEKKEIVKEVPGAVAPQVVYIRDTSAMQQQQAILSRLEELSRELKQVKTLVMVPLPVSGRNSSAPIDTSRDTIAPRPARDSLRQDSPIYLSQVPLQDLSNLAGKNDLKYVYQRMQYIEAQLDLLLLKLDTMPQQAIPAPASEKTSEDKALLDSIGKLMKIMERQNVQPTPQPPPPMAQAPQQGTLYVFFKVNSSTLQPEFREVLRKAFTAQKPVSVKLAGYADPSGNADYNKQLSRKRAEAVAAFLTSQLGISGDKITVIVLGESEDSTTTQAAYERRVEVQVQY